MRSAFPLSFLNEPSQAGDLVSYYERPRCAANSAYSVLEIRADENLSDFDERLSLQCTRSLRREVGNGGCEVVMR